MRYLIGMLLPLIVQMIAFLIVIEGTSGGGKFSGLLLIPTAMFTTPMLLLVGFMEARSGKSLANLILKTMAIAIVPSIVILISAALES